MQIYADLHLHSKYSRATSSNSDLEHFYSGAKTKGLNLICTGDFSHPKWFKEIKEKLEEVEEKGLFKLREKNQDVLFMLSNEVSAIYSTKEGVKKIHLIIYAPSFEDVEKINDAYSKLGNLEADGRPTFGNCSSPQLIELTKEASKDSVIVPAHAWTPWFSVFGSKSGFNSLKECFQEQTKHVFAIETGLSSDPSMNWRLSQLDEIALMSNSDSHSPNPERIGRECNVFEFTEEELSYWNLFKAVKEKDKKHFKKTLEVHPFYGKYHYTGHRNCGISFSPKEAIKARNICPICRKELTIGVEERVEELADRQEGFTPPNAIPFNYIISLNEVIAETLGKNLSSPIVEKEAQKTRSLGSEYYILLEATKEEIERVSGKRIAEAITRVRNNSVKYIPGYDGVYGRIIIFPEEEKQETKNNIPTQKSLNEFT